MPKPIKTLKQEWEDAARAFGPNTPQSAKDALQGSFYCGAAFVFKLLAYRASENETDEEAAEITTATFDSLEREFEEFNDLLTARNARIRASQPTTPTGVLPINRNVH